MENKITIMIIDSKEFQMLGVIIGQKQYKAKSGQEKYQYKISSFGLTFNFIGTQDFTEYLSDLTGTGLKSLVMSCEFATFNDALYVQLKGVELRAGSFDIKKGK